MEDLRIIVNVIKQISSRIPKDGMEIRYNNIQLNYYNSLYKAVIIENGSAILDGIKPVSKEELIYWRRSIKNKIYFDKSA